MEYWPFIVGFTSAVVSGVLVHIAKDYFAAKRDVKRKRKALWLACANESREASDDFTAIEWTRDCVDECRGIGSSPTLGCVSATLARTLLELDPENIEVYQGLILSEELFRHRGLLAHEELERFTPLQKPERKSLQGMVIGELLGLADALLRLEKARLAVLRVLKGSVEDDKARQAISSAERCLPELQTREATWRGNYASSIGQSPAALRSKA